MTRKEVFDKIRRSLGFQAAFDVAGNIRGNKFKILNLNEGLISVARLDTVDSIEIHNRIIPSKFII